MDDAQRQERRELVVAGASRLRVANARLHAVFGEPAREITFWEKRQESRGLQDQEGAWVGPANAMRWVFDEVDRIHGSPAKIKAMPEYQQAHDEYWSAFTAFYTPEFTTAVRRLKAGDRDAVEEALLFLEADPWCMGSGYMKQDLMRFLRHVPLSEDERQRLRAILGSCIRAGPRMEFREACRTASTVDSQEFRRMLLGLRDQPLHGSGVRQRAGWMLDAIIRTNGE